MKTVTVSQIGQDDLINAVCVVINNTQCAIYYPDDQLPAAAAPSLEEQQAEIAKEYDAELMAHYDRMAQTQGFENMMTCMLRASRPGPFYAQGVAYFDWVERCNVLGYTLIAEVKAGTKPLPSKAEFIAGLPPMVWPT